jgi:glutathione reductase (NADPH)
MVDELPLGGTCALRGCDPKKVLVGNAEAIEWVRRLEGKGVRWEGLRVDWPELMRFKRDMIAGYSDRKERGLLDRGIEVVHGHAMFIDGHTIRVGDRRIEAKRIAIATGAKPGPLSIPGEEHLTYSNGFLDLEQLPRRIAFIGGGYISFEFAHVAARSGANVTILHRGKRSLKGFDADLAMRLADKSRKIGIDLRLERQVGWIARRGSGLTVGSVHDGSEEVVEVDMVVHGAGRGSPDRPGADRPERVPAEHFES